MEQILYSLKLKIYSTIYKNTNPIDLYKFMYEIGEMTDSKHTLITDAGSNYYAGGQVWFNRNQNEISSTTNAAMGLSVPLSIGLLLEIKINR